MDQLKFEQIFDLPHYFFILANQFSKHSNPIFYSQLYFIKYYLLIFPKHQTTQESGLILPYISATITFSPSKRTFLPKSQIFKTPKASPTPKKSKNLTQYILFELPSTIACCEFFLPVVIKSLLIYLKEDRQKKDNQIKRRM